MLSELLLPGMVHSVNRINNWVFLMAKVKKVKQKIKATKVKIAKQKGKLKKLKKALKKQKNK